MNLSLLSFIGVIDLIAEMEGKRTLVEFKTAVADFEDYERSLCSTSFRLTSWLSLTPSRPPCVFIKSKEARINWHVTKRKPEQVMEYLEKTELVAGQIEQGNSASGSESGCRQCEFLPVCTGNEREAVGESVEDRLL